MKRSLAWMVAAAVAVSLLLAGGTRAATAGEDAKVAAAANAKLATVTLNVKGLT